MCIELSFPLATVSASPPGLTGEVLMTGTLGSGHRRNGTNADPEPRYRPDGSLVLRGGAGASDRSGVADSVRSFRVSFPECHSGAQPCRWRTIDRLVKRVLSETAPGLDLRALGTWPTASARIWSGMARGLASEGCSFAF